jgi:hypothetical protein
MSTQRVRYITDEIDSANFGFDECKQTPQVYPGRVFEYARKMYMFICFRIQGKCSVCMSKTSCDLQQRGCTCKVEVVTLHSPEVNKSSRVGRDRDQSSGKFDSRLLEAITRVSRILNLASSIIVYI